jgi:hypothetical protein
MIHQHFVDYHFDRSLLFISDFRPAFNDSIVVLASA